MNCFRDAWKSRRRAKPAAGDPFGEMLEQLADPASALSHAWNEEHDRHVAQRLLQLVRHEFTEVT